jgi:hypothetical protein
MVRSFVTPRTLLAAAVALGTVAALAPPARADYPEVGKPWVWPTVRDWLEASPTGNDSAGKVVVHWFCKPRLEDCKVDLSRVFNLREKSNVYVIAYIDGSKRDAGKLDPVRAEVGAGAVAYGRPVKALFKQLGIDARLPMSVVVDVDGKVALISYTGDPDQLDLRDRKVASLVESIKAFTVQVTAPPGQVKKGQRFELGVKAELASWLVFDRSVKPEIKLRLPPDVTCDATVIEADAIKMTGRTMSASVGCRGSVKGSYEATGSLRFSYRAPNKAIGVGQDAVRWKFAVAP